MDGTSTIESFQKILLPFEKSLKRNHPSIQFQWEGDNARAHTSKKVIAWLEKKIKHVPFGGKPISHLSGRPPNSPDLCIIEYIFNTWNEHVMNQSPSNLNELIQIAEKKWRDLPQEYIENTYQHMHRV